MKNIILILFFIFCFFSCKKEIITERPEFIGTWIGKTTDFYYQIKVDENSNATFTEYFLLSSGTKQYSGIARANNTVFKIGRFHSFNINVYPHKIDTTNSQIYVNYPTMFSFGHTKKANWEMELRQVVYNKADY